MPFIPRQEPFVCEYCGADIAPLEHGTYRNHCPACLWSKHVDEAGPGDRASHCKGLMGPTAIDLDGKKGWVILHRCVSCGKEMRNKAAPDDALDVCHRNGDGAKEGFTLIEVLLIVAILAILIGIILMKIKPMKRQIEALDVQRKADALSIQSAATQFTIETVSLPPGTPIGTEADAKDICQSGLTGTGCLAAPVNGVDLSTLAPVYLVRIPLDPAMSGSTVTGYRLFSDGEEVFVTTPFLGRPPTRQEP